MSLDPNSAHLDRTLWIVGGIAPLLLLAGSALYSTRSPPHSRLEIAQGWMFMAGALLFCVLNLYWAFVRPRLHLRRHRSWDGYQHISVMPLVGTVFVIIATLCCFGSPWLTALGFLATMADVGGSVWLVFWMLRNNVL